MSWQSAVSRDRPTGSQATRTLIAVSMLVSSAALADGHSELAQAALARTLADVRYDGAYQQIDYPNGDVPPNVGVCTDVLVRSFRTIGIDLQRSVHADMRAAFSEYPKIWGLTKPDTNKEH